MEELGRHLRARAKQLGLADAEVARRAGLTERRYGHYVTGSREPSLSTLVRICAVLSVTPNDLLGFASEAELSSQRDRLIARLASAAISLKLDDLLLTVKLVETLIQHRASPRRPKPV